MPRKEELEAWRKKKIGAPISAKPVKSTPATVSLRSKVQNAAKKSTAFQASNNRNSANNERNVVNAGKKKIGANTPIGKLKARLREVDSTTSNKENTAKCNKKLFGDTTKKTTSSIIASSSVSQNAIQMRMEDAESLAKKHGTHVARAMLEELPKDEECAHLELLSKALYWLTWIKIEQDAHEWERVEKLFLRAEPLVRSAVDKRVIAVAYESFREKADALLEEKMNSIGNTQSNPAISSQPAVHTFVPRVAESSWTVKRKFDTIVVDQVDESSSRGMKSSSNCAFEGVNVSSTRMKFEDGNNHTKQDSQSTISSADAGASAVSVKSLAQNLLLNMGKARLQGRVLPGAVALPGMPAPVVLTTRSTEAVAQETRDTLSQCLGISEDEDDEDDDDIIGQDEEEEGEEVNVMMDLRASVQQAAPDVHSEDKNQDTAPVASKRVNASRAPVRLTRQAMDVCSDSDDDEEKENEEEETQPEVMLFNPTRQVVLPPSCQSSSSSSSTTTTTESIPSSHKTRSGVCFADQNYTTPGKGKEKKSLVNKKKKRQGTPFRPAYDDIILPSPSDEE